MRWVCHVPTWEEVYRYTYLRSRVERLAVLAHDPRSPRRSGAPPRPEACNTERLPGLTPLTFFWPKSGQPKAYIERRLLAVQDPGWRQSPDDQNFPDLPTALRVTSEHILVRKGLGKTTALLHAFWSTYRENASGDGSGYIPCWLYPDDELLREDLLAHCPPVLFFVDLRELPVESREDFVRRMAMVAGSPGCQHHRFVIAHRGWRKPQTDSVAGKLVEFVSRVFEVKPLGVEEAARRWAERGFSTDEVVGLSKILKKRIGDTRPPAIPNNLPVSLTSFVGRDEEMAEVRRLLFTSRLLTLTGPGGCGKTRLALQVASDLLHAFGDGVWLVELAVLEDPVLVPQAVALALGVREEPGYPLIETLVSSLRSRELLLMLDNCEHLIEACAMFAHKLLSACPNLRILATSREALDVGGEIAWLVPSLSTPKPKRLPPLEGLKQYEAVELFDDRAATALLGFSVTDRNAPSVAQVCHRLDGIPLAIELAAARVRTLPVEQIAAQLDDSIRLLTGGSRTAPPRQQTLQTTLDWSYNLLSEKEQVLFRRLSVFRGGWSLEAVEVVCAGAGIEAPDVLELLSELVDKSLVVLEKQDGEARYRLLETVRQYGWEKLQASEETVAVCGRHRDWCLELAERAEPELRGAEQRVWLARLETEHDNLRAALRWVEESKEAEVDLRLSGALWYFWDVCGHLSEGRKWLEGALSRSGGMSPALCAKALSGAGVLARHQGDYEQATSFHEEALTLDREIGDKQSIVASLQHMGHVAADLGDYTQAETYFLEALDLTRETGNREHISGVLQALGEVATRRGDYSQAEAYFLEGLTLAREVGNREKISGLLQNLGVVAYNRGDYMQTEAYYQEALARAREMGHRERISGLLANLGGVATDRKDYVQAEVYLLEGLTIAREIGQRERTSLVLANLGILAYNRGDYVRAEAYFREGLALAREMGHRWLISGILNAKGEFHLKQQQLDLARAAFLEALETAREVGIQQFVATALYGLARSAAARNNTSEAHRRGQESLTIFESLDHDMAAEVRQWLAGLPSTSPLG